MIDMSHYIFDGVNDVVDDVARETKETLEIPDILKELSICTKELIALVQRQNDMINDSQEAANADLLNWSNGVLMLLLLLCLSHNTHNQ